MMDLLFKKWTLHYKSLSGPFLSEGGSSEPTEPPGYGPATVIPRGTDLSLSTWYVYTSINKSYIAIKLDYPTVMPLYSICT